MSRFQGDYRLTMSEFHELHADKIPL